MSLRLRTTLLMSADAILIALAYGFAVLIRFGEVPTLARLAGFTPVVAAAAVIGAALLWIYDTHRDLYRPLLDTVAAVLIACGVATLLTLAVPYALRLTAFPRSVFVLALPVQVVLLVAARLPWVFADRRRVMQQRIVVVGHDPDLARAIAAAVRLQMGAPKVDCACGSELEQLATGPRPDLLILAPDLSAAQREELHTWCAFSDVACLIVPKLEDLLCARARVGRIGDFPTLEARRPVLTPDHALIKRLLDLLGAIALGIACLPVALACAAAIKATEPRAPVLYRQRRVGLNGRVFTLYKFRTMIPDAEAKTGPVLAGPGDPRVTLVGRLLRATRLDELPQLWNVLRGDMSLVGPRPERPEFVAAFVEKTPLYRLRHNVRPGLTGLAQIWGRYDSDYRDKLRYDLLYVAYASPLLDLKIILLTLRVMFLPAQLPRLETLVGWRGWAAATPGDLD